MTVGERLTQLRNRAGLTQQNVADKLFVSRSLVTMWETGRKQPPFEMVERYCEVTGFRLVIVPKEAS